MSSAASDAADARALAALLGTELGAALLQGHMQVLMLPPRKEQPPLGASSASASSGHPRPAASAAIEAQLRRGCDFSTPVEVTAPLQSPITHNASPPRGAGVRSAGLGGLANEAASASAAMSLRRASSDLAPRSPAALSPSSADRSPSSAACRPSREFRRASTASPGLGGLADEAASAAAAMSLRRASSDAVVDQRPPAVLAPEPASPPRAFAGATASSPSTPTLGVTSPAESPSSSGRLSSPGSLSRGRQNSFERSAVRKAKNSPKAKESLEGALAFSAAPASSLAPTSSSAAAASDATSADADADDDTFEEQSEMGTRISLGDLAAGSTRSRGRQQSEIGAKISLGDANAGGASLPAASVSASGGASRRGPSCCQLSRARAGRGHRPPPKGIGRAIATSDADAAADADDVARTKAEEEAAAEHLWKATFGAAAGPPPPGTTTLLPPAATATGPGRSASTSAARYPPPPSPPPPPPAAATTGAAAWLAAAEEEEDAEMVCAEISSRRRDLHRASSRAELAQLPTVTPPAKPKRSPSILGRLSLGRKPSPRALST